MRNQITGANLPLFNKRGIKSQTNRPSGLGYYSDLLGGEITAVRMHGIPVSTGRFGADMQVASVNDGPVTLVIDSPN